MVDQVTREGVYIKKVNRLGLIYFSSSYTLT